MVVLKLVERQEWVLSVEGSETVRDGSHEAKAFRATPEAGITRDALQVCLPLKQLTYL